MTTSCGCDSRSPAVVTWMNSVSVWRALMSHTPQYPMPLRRPPAIGDHGHLPRPVDRLDDGGDLRPPGARPDARRADRARPDAHLHRVDAALDQRAGPRPARHVAAHELRVGKRLPHARHSVEHALGVAVRRVHHNHVAARVEQSPRAGERVGGAAYRRRHAQAAVLVLVGVGVLPALEDVLDGDEAFEDALLVDHGKLLDPVPGEDPLRLVERSADGRGDEPLLRHRGANRAVELALELQIAVRDDADQAPGVVHDRHAGDTEPLHQPYRLAQRAVRAERDGMQDHPRLAALHAIHFRRLPVDGHVLVDHPDPALARDRDGHLGLGDGVHRRRHERHVEWDTPGEAGANVDIPRMHAGVPRHEEHVVEGESGARAEASHGESYWGGGGSSTFSEPCFAASSTAAFPAAANFSRSFPAFPTASIVPRMMFTGTRPARSVSSSVSATFWNGAAPAGRSAYFDSRNST